MSRAERRARWGDMSLEARYEALYGPPAPQPPSAQPSVASLMRDFNVVFNEEEQAERDRIVRRTKARVEIDRAIAAEAEREAAARKVAYDDTMRGTAVGLLMSRR
jgi:hypothetical protein